MISHASYLLLQNNFLSYLGSHINFNHLLPLTLLALFFFPWYTRILDALISKSTVPTIQILQVIVTVNCRIAYGIVKSNLSSFPRDWGWVFALVFYILLVAF